MSVPCTDVGTPGRAIWGGGDPQHHGDSHPKEDIAVLSGILKPPLPPLPEQILISLFLFESRTLAHTHHGVLGGGYVRLVSLPGRAWLRMMAEEN